MRLSKHYFLALIISISLLSFISCDDGTPSPNISPNNTPSNNSNNSSTPNPEPNAELYKNIDDYVLKTPIEVAQSIDSLSTYIVATATNDKEKTRAIYRWVTNNINYDAQGFFTKEYGDLSAENVLKTRKGVCEGYANLFEALAQKAGLEVVKIGGYAKGYGFASGTNINSNEPNHAWNAVKIDGQWQLVDSTWGAGYLNDQKQFVKRFQDHYFLTPPSEFIVDHFPEDNKWQLLNTPISMQDFQQLVSLKPPFFENHLSLVSHKQSLITANESLEVSLSAPMDVLVLASLNQNGQNLDESLTFIQREGNLYKILVHFPKTGQYELNIFAGKDIKQSFDQALEYTINATSVSAGVVAFPQTFATFTQNNAFLYSPLEKDIEVGKQYEFKLKVPNANNVAIFNGSSPINLQKNGEYFEGVIIPNHGDFGVFASFSGTNDRQYFQLLKYQTN